MTLRVPHVPPRHSRAWRKTLRPCTLSTQPLWEHKFQLQMRAAQGWAGGRPAQGGWQWGNVRGINHKRFRTRLQNLWGCQKCDGKNKLLIPSSETKQRQISESFMVEKYGPKNIIPSVGCGLDPPFQKLVRLDSKTEHKPQNPEK